MTSTAAELIAAMTRICMEDGCETVTVARGLCRPHYKVRERAGTLPEKLTPEQRTHARFWANVEKTSTCWEWRGSISVYGYGQFGARERSWRAHRFAWVELRGEIPTGLVLDHLCRNRACVNPDHLEPVTDRVNTLRGIGGSALNAAKTHCKRGHEFDAENTATDNHGNRECVECRRHRQREYKRRVRAVGGTE